MRTQIADMRRLHREQLSAVELSARQQQQDGESSQLRMLQVHLGMLQVHLGTLQDLFSP